MSVTGMSMRGSSLRRTRFQNGLAACSLLLPILLAGCSSPGGLRGAGSADPPDPHSIPFQDANASTPKDSDSGISHTSPDSAAKPETPIPFGDSQNLPAGTLLTVRLNDSISADHPGPTDLFQAVVDDPVTVDGNTLIPRGSSVAGRIQSAHVSNVNNKRGYVRLELDSLDLAGRDIPLQTSTLFARGTSAQAASEAAAPVILEKGRRLTFRLTEPAYILAKRAVPTY